MSVSVEQPLHFQQPASPTFSSPPHSPNHLPRTPTTSPPPAPARPTDVDMSASAPTLPQPGQRHDREDADMQDGENLTNGQTRTQQASPALAGASTNTVAVEVAVVDDDAMDTTPDTDQHLVLPNGSANPGSTSTAQLSPEANGSNGEAAESSARTDSAASAHDLVSIYLPHSFTPVQQLIATIADRPAADYASSSVRTESSATTSSTAACRACAIRLRVIR